MNDMPTPVLIVCDDAMARAATRQGLEKVGCKSIEAADAEYGLELLSTRPDLRGLIVASHQIGMMTGIALAWITIDRWPKIERIVVICRDLPRPGQLPDKADFVLRPLDVDAVIRLLTRRRTDCAPASEEPAVISSISSHVTTGP